MLQSGIVFLSDVTYELQSINPRLCQYRCDNDDENAFVLKRAPTINHTWTDGFGTVYYNIVYLCIQSYYTFCVLVYRIPYNTCMFDSVYGRSGGAAIGV